MSDVFQAERKNIQQITEGYVIELTKIWTHLFDEELCREHLHKFVDHVEVFYKELITESTEKKKLIEDEIKNLRNEAENLQRLLKTEVNIPQVCPSKPLLILQMEIDENLIDLRKCLRQRKEQICELLLEQEALCDELDESPRPLPADPLPTEQEIENFRQHLEKLRNERFKRISNLALLRRDIKSFLDILGLNVNTETDELLLNERQIKLNKENFAGLQRMHKCFKMQVDEMRDQIIAMRKKLNVLWERLETSPITKNKIQRYTEYTHITYDIFSQELQRCEILKRENIKRFVDQLRNEIIGWWDKLLKSEAERSRFSNFHNSCYTDDLLVLHEMELDDLKQFYEANHEIYELFAERNILWERMCALELKASDPARYNNRGGQLLKEEKERKIIATKLPKIEQQITKLVMTYTEKEHKPFNVNGEDILMYMSNEWEQKRINKEKLSSARKNLLTPLSKSHSTAIRTPMSLKNISSVSSRNAASTTNLSAATLTTQKRKLKLSNNPVPPAKRNLYKALNSHSLFQKSKSGSSVKESGLKSPGKKMHRVLATTIRRKSGRQSGNLKKRVSSHKNSAKIPPRIIVSECDSAEDTYDSFQKCIEPASRSSVIQPNVISSKTSRENRLRDLLYSNENARLAILPNPRALCTPKKNVRKFVARTPPSFSPGLSITNSNRKLTTKNLPILI